MREDIIVITGGDPAGIGPEMLRSMSADFRAAGRRILYLFTAGKNERSAFERAIREHGLSLADVPLKRIAEHSFEHDITLAAVDEALEDMEPGRPSEHGGQRAFQALRAACEFIGARGCRGLLTAPALMSVLGIAWQCWAMVPLG